MTDIACGERLENAIAAALGECSLTITDVNVARLYPQFAGNAFVIAAGEKSKSPEVLFSIIEQMKRRNVKRGDKIAALGGGVIGDITGLAAALYMRGIDWICLPTTLLAMVDSGIGGKTAVDCCGEKNLVGAFHFPQRTIISYHFLETLDKREWMSGLGELIKTCLLTERAFAHLMANEDEIINRNSPAVHKLIAECVRIKKTIVAADPKEKGLRKILNVGHTVGHALEAADDYRLPHGEYVLKGMMTECAMCREYISSEYYSALIRLFSKLTSPPRTSVGAVVKYAQRDKKNTCGITLVLPMSIGELVELSMTERVFEHRYETALRELRQA